MTNKKLKDLKRGDKVWFWHFTFTTPITVESAKREGDLMRVTVRWDDSTYECFGPALGLTCVGYDHKFHSERMFTCSYDLSYDNERRTQRIKDVVPKMKELIKKIEEI
jgi:hypothetical protein